VCAKFDIARTSMLSFSAENRTLRDMMLAGSRRHFYHSNWSQRSPPRLQFPSRPDSALAQHANAVERENCMLLLGRDTRERRSCARLNLSVSVGKNSMASPRPFELMVLTWKWRKETLLIEMTARLWFFVPNDKLIL
jgi:hypothetical protein